MKKTKRLSKLDKVRVIMESPEIITATKLLLACFIDIKSKHFIMGGFELGNENFQLIFRKLPPQEIQVTVKSTGETKTLKRKKQ